jgi:outer membrane protein OmpA-like peptidoglycan-associated protein
MRQALIIALATALPACTSSNHIGAASDSITTAIYSPPVRVGEAGSMMLLSTARVAPEAAAQEVRESDNATTLLSATKQMPPPPSSDCFMPGPWTIFFSKDKADLNNEAKSALTYLVEKERDPCGKFDLQIEGHINDGERSALSRQRAEAVRRYLQGQKIGVRMTVQDLGNSKPRVPNTSVDSEIHNPRVEIHVR